MSRVYGDINCHQCGRASDTGWLFVCQQDHEPLRDLPSIDLISIQLNETPEGDHGLEIKAGIAETLGIHPLVITSIRAGEYTDEQATRLIRQKIDLIKVIKKAKRSSARLASHFNFCNDAFRNVITQAGNGTPVKTVVPPGTTTAQGLQAGTLGVLPPTPCKTPHDGSTSPAGVSSPTESPRRPTVRNNSPKCNFHICSTCRPYFRDRMYASFESAYNDELPHLTQEQLNNLPIINPRVARNIGLRPTPITPTYSPGDSVDVTHQNSLETDEISVNWSPTDTEEETSRSSSFATDNISPKASRAPSDLYPCPGPHHCPVYSRHSGCAYDLGFDDGRRAANHGYVAESETDIGPLSIDTSIPSFRFNLERAGDGSSSTASSVSLPTPTTTTKGGIGLAPLLPSEHDDDDDDAAWFNVTLRKKMTGTKAKSAVVLGRNDDFGGNLRIRDSSRDSRRSFSSASEGSEVEVDGGVALTEEAVVRGMADLRMDAGGDVDNGV
jgi:hypothetical protein